MRQTILLPALFLFACEAAPDQPVSEEPASILEEEASEPEGVDTLAGSWRVAEINGDEYVEIPQLELYANSRLIYWEPACAGMERRYSIDGKEFSANALPSDGPQMVCSIGLPAGLEETFAALDEADRIEAREGGGVMISGLRARVVLMPI